ncbi:serine acetyltransferase [Paenibacillus xerothermodurans]|uniref:Serine acetyltransferase n=2 Tax=Paenibacillus xerothermodurans TaxID=1977292 RepID=A0A2W1N7W2_PAEXE|nr:serine acetyltransferase [Paenibacillus xerothermodurans]
MKLLWHIIIGRSVRAILIYRISAWCYRNHLRPLAHFFWSMNLLLHSIEISPLARIGPGLVIPHTLGIVIGGGAVIGRDVTIYQNVTIGTKNGKDYRYPSIGDNTVLFSGCVVVGPIKIGNNAVVGANAVVVSDVPNDSIALGIPAVVKNK